MHGFLLYRIRHKSIQVVAEGIGLDYACNVFVCKKIEHFADSQIGSSRAYKRTMVAGKELLNFENLQESCNQLLSKFLAAL